MTTIEGVLLNSYQHPIYINNICYPSIEHFIQSVKFKDRSFANIIISSKSVEACIKLGKNKDFKIDPLWEKNRAQFLKEALIAKALQCEVFKEALLKTTGPLILRDESDYYWGLGKHCTGRNMLGKIMAEVREFIRSNQICERKLA